SVVAPAATTMLHGVSAKRSSVSRDAATAAMCASCGQIRSHARLRCKGRRGKYATAARVRMAVMIATLHVSVASTAYDWRSSVEERDGAVVVVGDVNGAG